MGCAKDWRAQITVGCITVTDTYVVRPRTYLKFVCTLLLLARSPTEQTVMMMLVFDMDPLFVMCDGILIPGSNKSSRGEKRSKTCMGGTYDTHCGSADWKIFVFGRISTFVWPQIRDFLQGYLMRNNSNNNIGTTSRGGHNISQNVMMTWHVFYCT